MLGMLAVALGRLQGTVASCFDLLAFPRTLKLSNAGQHPPTTLAGTPGTI